MTEFCECGFVKIIFVRSRENRSDGFTKNVTKEIYEDHARHMIFEKKEFEEQKHRGEEGEHPFD